MALCLLLVAVVAAMDASLPSGGIEAVLLVGPVFASSQLSPRRTALVAVVALAAGLSIAALHHRMGEPDVIIRLVALLVVGAFCVASAQARERRERALTRVTKVAEVAQLAILHKVPARVGPIAFATRYLSAARDAFVGGDFYDVVATADVVRVVVGDVRGKGLDAVNLAALVAGCFREAAATQEGLADVGRALAKLDDGTYAQCDVCGEPVGAERQEALPWAVRCVEDAARR